MARKGKYLAFPLAIALLLYGCGEVVEDSSAESVIEVYLALPLPDLSIKVPENFTATSSEYYEEYYICDDASIIITSTSDDAPYSSAASYAETAIAAYKELATSFTLVAEETYVSGHYTVKSLEFTYQIGEDSELMHCVTGYLTDSATMYIITCKSLDRTFADYYDSFVEVLETATVIN